MFRIGRPCRSFSILFTSSLIPNHCYGSNSKFENSKLASYASTKHPCFAFAKNDNLAEIYMESENAELYSYIFSCAFVLLMSNVNDF